MDDAIASIATSLTISINERFRSNVRIERLRSEIVRDAVAPWCSVSIPPTPRPIVCRSPADDSKGRRVVSRVRFYLSNRTSGDAFRYRRVSPLASGKASEKYCLHAICDCGPGRETITYVNVDPGKR